MESEIIDVKDLKISGGPEIKDGSTILLLYKVALSEEALDRGGCIESTYSPDIPKEITVSKESLIEGVYRGLLGMKGGGSVRRIKIPSSLAFGTRGYREVPSDASLFVELCIAAVLN